MAAKNIPEKKITETLTVNLGFFLRHKLDVIFEKASVSKCAKNRPMWYSFNCQSQSQKRNNFANIIIPDISNNSLIF